MDQQKRKNKYGRVGLGFRHPYTPKYIGSAVSRFSQTTNWESIDIIIWDLSGEIITRIGTQIIMNIFLRLCMLF